MFGRKNNPFISRMSNNLEKAMDGSYRHVPCAKEIIPMLEDFFVKCTNAKFDLDVNDVVCWRIEKLTEIMMHIAMNTRNYEKLSVEDIIALRKIFEELNALLTEALEVNSQSDCQNDFDNKINCINEIICKNMVAMHDSEEKHDNYRDGMIFQNYEDLWKVIHRVNTEWNQLCSRGFSLRVFYDYWEAFKYDRLYDLEKAEGEKLETFMALLDGKMKCVPVYEHRPVCFKVVDNDFEGEIIRTFENRYSKPYRLRQEGEEITECVSTEG